MMQNLLYTRTPPTPHTNHTNFHEAKPTLDFQASYVLYFYYSCPSPPFRALKKHTNCRVSFLAKNEGRSDSRCASPLRIDLQLRSTEPI